MLVVQTSLPDRGNHAEPDQGAEVCPLWETAVNERRIGDRRTGTPQPAPIPSKPSARVFIHPRCWSGPAFGAMSVGLEAGGVDTAAVKVGPLGKHNRRELVREISQVGAITTYERMDGTRFEHRMGCPAPEPEVA